MIQSGPAGAHSMTAWFRHAFQVADPTLLPTVRVRLLCDDAAVVFVNGIEVARWNLHNFPVAPGHPASTSVAGAAENEYRVFPFPPILLVPGTNSVAVQVHQVSPSSSDLSFDLEMLAGPGPISVVRGPYLQNGTPGGATVQWRTDQPTETRAWIGPPAGVLQSVYYDATLRTDHRAILTGLSPETDYHYAIGDVGGMFTSAPTGTLRTLPPPGAVRPLRVWALGDAGFGWAPQYIVRDLYAFFGAPRAADAILMLGDNAYLYGTDREYQVGMFDVYGAFLRDTFCWSTLGNHDAVFVSTAAQTGPYYDIFSPPTAGEAGGLPSGTEAYYSFDRGHVHFVCLDSMDSDRCVTGAMMTWLVADLASTNARWIIAFFHHPPYSFGSHHSDDPLDSGGRLFDMRQVALPILEAGGVDLVLCGHSHSYERSFLIDGHYQVSSTLQPPMLLDRGDGKADGDGTYAKPTAGAAAHEGTVYVVAGSAGSVSGGLLNHPAMYVGLNNFGSLVIDVDGDRLDGSFIGVTGIEDRFTIEKGVVRTLQRDQPSISVTAGGRQDFRLDAGATFAGKLYLLLGSFGTEPGVSIFGVHLPLNPDPWLQLSLALANTPTYPNSLGVLDPAGQANASLVLPPLNEPTLVGTAIHHAYVVFSAGVFVHASNSVKMTFSP